MSRDRIFGSTLAVAVVVLLGVGLTCRRDMAESTTSPESTTSSTPRASTAAADQRATEQPATGSARQDDPGDERSTFARVAAGRSEHDLRLLADVQRQLDGPAPASIERLLALRDEGASREQLTQQIDEQVEGMMVQAACRRWLAREFEAAPGASEMGVGGKQPAVKPVRRRAPRGVTP